MRSTALDSSATISSGNTPFTADWWRENHIWVHVVLMWMSLGTLIAGGSYGGLAGSASAMTGASLALAATLAAACLLRPAFTLSVAALFVALQIVMIGGELLFGNGATAGWLYLGLVAVIGGVVGLKRLEMHFNRVEPDYLFA